MQNSTTVSHTCHTHAGGAWHLDPRLPGVLGLRTLLPASQQPAGLAGVRASTEMDYRAWRFLHGVPEGEEEMPAGACLYDSSVSLMCHSLISFSVLA